MKIGVVGCGFVGSVFLTEFVKRCFAGKMDIEFILLDDDTVEDRNCANQNFMLVDAGRSKAQVMAELVERNNLLATWKKVRVTEENIRDLLGDCQLVVDGVDNLATRQMLWAHAHETNTPVVHIGITQMGTGSVEWSHPKHDTFSLSPKKTVGKTIVDPQSGVTPPCELARMRGVGLNVGLAAAWAVSIFLGFDPEAHFNGQASAQTFTEWQATLCGVVPQRSTWEQFDDLRS